MGLDRPFFDDKNRAFWILQSIGWSGYFFLRSLSGFANSMGWMWLIHTLLLTATGYSLTLLMASLFRRLIKMMPVWTLVLSLLAVMLSSTAFSVIETWSYATFLKPTAKPVGGSPSTTTSPSPAPDRSKMAWSLGWGRPAAVATSTSPTRARRVDDSSGSVETSTKGGYREAER